MKRWVPDRYRQLRSLIRRGDVDEEVAEEFQHHIELSVEENLAAGMSPGEAREEALRRFGDMERFRRETTRIDQEIQRRERRRHTMGALNREARHAARGLLRQPGFTVIVVLTLAIGIGAISAIFSVTEGVVLRPLPYPDAERLIWVESRVPGIGPDAVWGLSEAGYHNFRSANQTLEELGAFSTASVNLAGEHGAARVRAAAVTASLLDALRARPVLGRLIEEPDDVPDGRNVALLGHGFWERQFGGDPNVVGSSIEVNSRPYEVIGVLEPGFDLPDIRVDVWLPRRLDPARPPVNAHWLAAIGRLRDGVSVAQAQRDLNRLTERFTELFPSAYSPTFMRESRFTTTGLPLRERVVGDVDRVLWVLFGSVGLVLLIACGNVANLFLVRTEGRRRELAIRSALGAEQAHLAWHYLTESLLLSLASGALALGLAYLAIDTLVALAPSGLPRLDEIGVGWSAIAFTAVVSVLVGLAFGSLPLVRNVVDYAALRDGGRGLTGSRRGNLAKKGLVIAQVSMALILVAGAGLMLRSFQRLRAVESGLDPQNVLTVDVSLPAAEYGNYERVNSFFRGLLTRIEGLPGVRTAAATQKLPLRDLGGCSLVFVEDDPPEPDEQAPCVATPQVTPGFFESLDIPVDGESFEWPDMEARRGGVVVTRALAERLWPAEDPIGRGVRGNGWGQPFYRVTGVSADIRAEGLDRPPLQAVFFPMIPIEGAPLWTPPRSMSLVIEMETARPETVTPAVRRILAEIDATIPLANAQTMEDVVARSPAMARTSFTLLLLGLAGGMALLLAGIGAYGVISYVVGQRTAEIGIRIAMGAQIVEVVRMVVGQSIRLAITGVAIGLAGALALTRLLGSLLFEVRPGDPLTLAAVSTLLILLALVASYVPARRAARVDPMEALRVE